VATICDGWRPVDTPELSVVEERVPPGARELRHYHNQARQFFYALLGTAVLETEGKEHQIPAGSGIEVAQGVQHKFINKSDQDVAFLVISAPSTKADRINVEEDVVCEPRMCDRVATLLRARSSNRQLDRGHLPRQPKV
jgi:uncharacterized cupin superfamily protein